MQHTGSRSETQVQVYLPEACSAVRQVGVWGKDDVFCQLVAPGLCDAEGAVLEVVHGECLLDRLCTELLVPREGAENQNKIILTLTLY